MRYLDCLSVQGCDWLTASASTQLNTIAVQHMKRAACWCHYLSASRYDCIRSDIQPEVWVQRLHVQACCCDILVPQEPVLIVWEFIMLASVLVLPYTIAFDIDFVLE